MNRKQTLYEESTFSTLSPFSTLSIETICVQGSSDYADPYGAVSCPIYQNATFAHPALGASTGYDYSRVSNPTRDELQKTVALLEGGTQAFAFSSGMAAISALMELFANGDHIIATDDLYGGTVRLWNQIGKKNGYRVSLVDTSDLEAVAAAITPSTRAIYLETPSNPMMKVADISAIAKLAHSAGCLLLVDNTFLTPYFQRPLELGADVVIHSGTKYLGGHNDVLAGFLVVKEAQEKPLSVRLQEIYKTTGACLSPMDSWLVIRGIKTLALRMEQHQKNAVRIAEWLRGQKKVKKVYYIGLPDHPQAAVIKKQCKGFGGMVSFQVEDAGTAEAVLNNVRLIRFAESLGGVESLITYPARQTHAELPKEQREALGIDETLLRLSVGVENVEDLLQDLAQAFEKAEA